MLILYFFAPIVLYVYGVSGFLLVYLGLNCYWNLFSLYLYKDKVGIRQLEQVVAFLGFFICSSSLCANEIEVNFLPGYIFGALYFGYSVYMM